MSGNTALGKSVLREWYDTAKQYPTNFSMPFEDFVAYLESINNNTFLDNLGDVAASASKNIGIDAVRQNMRDLASATQGLVDTFPDGAPRFSYWGESILQVSAAGFTNLSFVKKALPEAAAETITQVEHLAIGGLGLYLLGAGLGIGLLIYLNTSGLKQKIGAHRQKLADLVGGSS